jgi:hypothetical protein
MKSIKKRLGNRVAECLEYTEVHGRSAGMDKYGIKCYVAFVKFLEGETNDPNFGIAMETNNPSLAERYRPVDMRLIDELVGRVSLLKLKAALEKRIAEREKRIQELEQQLIENATAEDYVPERVGIPI